MLYSRQCSDPAKRRSLLLAEALGRRGLWQRVFAAAEDIRNAEFGTAEEVRQYWRSWQSGREDALGVLGAFTALTWDSVHGEQDGKAAWRESMCEDVVTPEVRRSLKKKQKLKI